MSHRKKSARSASKKSVRAKPRSKSVRKKTPRTIKFDDYAIAVGERCYQSFPCQHQVWMVNESGRRTTEKRLISGPDIAAMFIEGDEVVPRHFIEYLYDHRSPLEYGIKRADVVRLTKALKIDTKFIPISEIMKGIKVELEHGSELDQRVNVTGDDLFTTLLIALAHFVECGPNYYKGLEKMEKKTCKRQKKHPRSIFLE